MTERLGRDATSVPAYYWRERLRSGSPSAAGGKMIPCNGIHILPARSEPVAKATRARAGERRLSRRRGDATHGERRTMALGDPAREAPLGDHGGAMATSGSHRAQPFGGRGRCERRRTKRDPGERCQGGAARATPCVAGVPPVSGTHRPQGRSMSIRKSPGQMVGAFLRIIGNGRYLPAFFCDSFYTSYRSYMVDRLRAV